MQDSFTNDFALDRTPSAFGNEGGYELWFDLPARSGDATTPEIQTLCRGSIAVGYIACRMGWDWATTIHTVDHLSAPVDGHLLIEVSDEAFTSAIFRRALAEAVLAVGLDEHKVRLTDERGGNVYVLGEGLPALLAGL